MRDGKVAWLIGEDAYLMALPRSAKWLRMQAMFETWSLAVTLAASGGAPPLAGPAALQALVAAPLRAAAGGAAPGGSRPGTLHSKLIEPVRCSDGIVTQIFCPL